MGSLMTPPSHCAASPKLSRKAGIGVNEARHGPDFCAMDIDLAYVVSNGAPKLKFAVVSNLLVVSKCKFDRRLTDVWQVGDVSKALTVPLQAHAYFNRDMCYRICTFSQTHKKVCSWYQVVYSPRLRVYRHVKILMLADG